MASEQSKWEFNMQQNSQVMVSSRWNPTPEQLHTLEELYRRGTRTPSAEQIQQITAQLRRYGKIEGKNVFYWFQNHKARERQKRRRQMELNKNQNLNSTETCEIETPGSKDRGAEGANSKTVIDHQQTNKNPYKNNNWEPPMNCNTLAEENSASNANKVAKAGGPHRKTSSIEWMMVDDPKPCRRNAVGETWQMMMHHHQLPCHPSSSPSLPLPTSHIDLPRMDPKDISNKSLHNNHHLTSFYITHPRPSAPLYSITNHNGLFNISGEDDHAEQDDKDNYEGSQTLQLFPLRSGDDAYSTEEAEMSVSAINGFVTHPHQFFEFLPLKN